LDERKTLNGRRSARGVACQLTHRELHRLSATRLCSRRDAIIGGLCLCCSPRLLRAARPESIEIEEIAAGVHVRRGVHENATVHNLDAIANVGFVVGSDAVAVIDPGGSLADGAHLRRRIREITNRPIRFVLLSHVHPDHLFGAGAFLEDEPTFLGHANLPAALAQRGEYYQARLDEVLGPGKAGPIVQPTKLVEHRTSIDLGDRVIELTAHSLAHTDNDVSAFDTRTRTLFTSDLLFVDRVPSLDGSLKGWLETLKALDSIAATRVVPGHGPVSTNFAKASRPLERYLNALLRGTRQAIADGIPIEEAPEIVALDERSQWALFDEYHGRNVTQAFKELEWE
jgi:quinoprotein relay system zinc metallohydrolase 2